MNLPLFLQPRPALTERDVAQGLRMITWEGVASHGLGSITASGFLAAFALALGASTFQVGVLAALPFVSQLFQVPAILLVEHLKLRKAVSVLFWFPAQLLWVPIALIPLLLPVPSGEAVLLLLGLIALRGILAAVTNCSWNGWIRDIVPQQILGRFFARRLALATAAAGVFGLGGAFFVDAWRGRASAEDGVFGYTIVLLVGALSLGLASPFFMARIPEPQVRRGVGQSGPVLATLLIPLRDRNFRRLLRFFLVWGFATNLAVPFFSVYMLQRLGLPLSGVITLTVLSQLFHILFLRVWGPFADRFSSKAVLYTSASLYLFVILGWTFTAMPDPHALTLPLLVGLHVFAGIAAAGVNLTIGTVGLKLAPEGRGTPYLAAASLATNLGSGLGLLVGGFIAELFSARALSFSFRWSDPLGELQLPAVSLVGFDFLFLLAFFIGLVTLKLLNTVQERGEVGWEEVLEELLEQPHRVTRIVRFVPGILFVARFPYSFLRGIPGLDVALGVTAYEVASGAGVASAAVLGGRRAVFRLAYEARSAGGKLRKGIRRTGRALGATHRRTTGREDQTRQAVPSLLPHGMGKPMAGETSRDLVRDIAPGSQEGVL